MPTERNFVSDETANRWMAELVAQEPDLRGAKVSMDRKAGGIGGDGAFRIYVGTPPKTICAFVISAANDNQTEFNARVKSFLAGATYMKEAPEGVTIEIGRGAAKVMGTTGILFDHGSVTFWEMPDHRGFNLAGSHGENKILVWEKVNETDLKITLTEKEGNRYEYPVRNGIFYPDEEKQIK